ncbi:glycosyltransferase [Paenibacillus spiritus]|uniref:Glycosyltransferase n=1 Tax=Paenibacillus spiritus TaxID=2496557 RepID=A0A5J5FR97_9BACL|nr:glycosyltransferase [Paenibacillus spiritus]KAA8995404.1 glycosyltransferase [Paenibacillus spiritus]
MNEMPLVSVVIPFYNCPYAVQAVESVLGQTYAPIEILVVDDASERHTEQLAPYLDRIRYIRRSVNGGTAAALNRGIEEAKGSYFAWLSSDDRFHPGKIAAQLDALHRSGRRFCHTGYAYIDGNGNRLPEGEVILSFRDRKELIATLMKGCPVNGSSVLMDMELFRRVGLFDERFRYTHDYELWLRVLPHYEWEYIPVPLLDYRVHSEMGSKRHGSEQAAEIGMIQQKYRRALSRLLRREGYACGSSFRF